MPARRVPAGHGRAGFYQRDSLRAYHGDFTTEGGRRAAEQIIAAGRMPRALVCANDQTAIGAMAALQHAGLSVPGDVAVTGFDGIQARPSACTPASPPWCSRWRRSATPR